MAPVAGGVSRFTPPASITNSGWNCVISASSRSAKIAIVENDPAPLRGARPRPRDSRARGGARRTTTRRRSCGANPLYAQRDIFGDGVVLAVAGLGREGHQRTRPQILDAVLGAVVDKTNKQVDRAVDLADAGAAFSRLFRRASIDGKEFLARPPGSARDRCGSARASLSRARACARRRATSGAGLRARLHDATGSVSNPNGSVSGSNCFTGAGIAAGCSSAASLIVASSARTR